ncbi:hypothetical protein Tco_1245323 [Tanacetum coccineum]
MGQEQTIAGMVGAIGGKSVLDLLLGRRFGYQKGINAVKNVRNRLFKMQLESGYVQHVGIQTAEDWVHLARVLHKSGPRRRDACLLQTQLLTSLKEEAGIQLQAEEFDLMAAVAALLKIEEVNANCFLMATFLQKHSTWEYSGTDNCSRHILRVPVVSSKRFTKFKRRNVSYLQQVDSRLQNFEIQFLKEAAKFVRDFKSLCKEVKNLLLAQGIELEIERLLWSSCQTVHDTIYENAKLRAQLFDKVSDQKDTNKGTSANTKFAKQSILGKPPSSSRPKLYVVTPLPNSTAFPKVGETNALSKPVTSNSVPSSRESTVVNNERVIAPGIFRINPFKATRVDNFVPNKHVKTSVRTKPIIVSQPHVITKNDVNSKTNGFSPKDIRSTTRTRRPKPWNNPKSDKVPFKSKSGCLSNKLEKIEENHRSLQSSHYPNHTSSECNNIKLAIRNEKSEVICATCKQCLITANHDDCVLQYVNGMKSRKKNQSANVSKSANQKKHKAQVWKPKNVGSKERFASPKPSKPRSCLRWSPTGRLFDLKGKIITSSESESQSDFSKGDNAFTSNPQEPIRKRFPSSTFSMTGCQNWFDTLLIPLLSEYKSKDKASHGDNECDT